MVLLPNCPCCGAGCTTDDSDGNGSEYENFFDYANAADAIADGWSVDGAAFTGTSVEISGSSIWRCTYVDISSDFKIVIEATISTFPLASPFSLVLDSDETGAAGLPVITCFRERGFGTNGGDILQVTDGGGVADEDRDNYDFGGADIVMRGEFSFVSGSWTTTYKVNGTSVLTDVACPDFSLPDNRFYHGISGTNDAKVVTRYYMKLTYL